MVQTGVVIKLSTPSWELDISDAWQDLSQDDLLRFFDPVSEAVLTISSTVIPEAEAMQVLMLQNAESLRGDGYEVTALPVREQVVALVGTSDERIVSFVYHDCCVVILTLAAAAEEAVALVQHTTELVYRIRFADEEGDELVEDT